MIGNSYPKTKERVKRSVPLYGVTRELGGAGLRATKGFFSLDGWCSGALPSAGRHQGEAPADLHLMYYIKSVREIKFQSMTDLGEIGQINGHDEEYD